MPNDIRSFFSSSKKKRKAPSDADDSAPKKKQKTAGDDKPKIASIFSLAKRNAEKKRAKATPGGGKTDNPDTSKKAKGATGNPPPVSSTPTKMAVDEKENKPTTPSPTTSGNLVPTPKKQKAIVVDATATTSLSADVLRERYKNNKYDPVKDAGWKKGEKMPYAAVAGAFVKISGTKKRLEKVRILADLLRSVILLSEDHLLQVCYLAVNQYAPPYAGIELGVGDSVIIKALVQSTGRQTKDIKADLVKEGDLGIVAQKSRANQKTMFPPPPLKVKGVFERFQKIAKTTGNRCMDEKTRLMNGLFVSAKNHEATFLVRALQGKMRIGLQEQTVFQALGRAIAFTPLAADCEGSERIADRSKKTKASKMHQHETHYTEIVKQVFAECPNYEIVIPALVKHGIFKLHDHVHLTPGIPIKAMLAKPTTGVKEILKRFTNMKFTLEYKYDGERAQIHLLPDGTLRFFSRSAEDNTEKFPDLVSTLKSFLKPGVKSFIIDSEVVAYDRKAKKILPFQVLTHRKRKDVKEEDVEIQVCVYAFDMLYLNGESLIREPFGTRREKMYQSFTETIGSFKFADYKNTDDPEQIEDYLKESIEQSCEGLMVKTLWKEATYEPSKRSHNWLKCKKDYLESGGDSLDLVVIGAFYGTGKRTGKYGSFLAACYDEDEDYYQSICKIGTGFSDEDLKNHFDTLSKIVLPKGKPSNYLVTDNFKCDVWFDAEQVWEVKCADLTVSPQHQAAVGLVHSEKGIALRFPRFMRIRDDKSATDATSAEQVAEMYNGQQQIQNM